MVEIEIEAKLRPVDRGDKRERVFGAREGHAGMIDRQIEVLDPARS